LDGDYISQQFSKGAGREFGKAYYVDTENFFSQGTFEVKTGFASSPLVYLNGSGVSGSASSGGPIAYAVGPCRLGYGSIFDSCNDPSFELYSSTGVIVPGVKLYYDQYGNSPVSGYKWLVDTQHDCQIWSINTTTGEVIADEGYNCPYCV